jgi:hypothetical protein
MYIQAQEKRVQTLHQLGWKRCPRQHWSYNTFDVLYVCTKWMAKALRVHWLLVPCIPEHSKVKIV